jgi:hypothetical protein
MKTTVIHHSADYDGIFCREIARKFLTEAELIGWDFADPPLPVPEGNVLVMDLPLDATFGGKSGQFNMGVVNAWESNRLIWIDHHQSAIKTHPPEVGGYQIDGVAACRLAWQWFTQTGPDNPPSDPALAKKEDFIERRVSEPIAVRLAGEYDIWDKRDPNAELFQHGLRSQELSRNEWEWLLSMNPGAVQVVEKLLNQGSAVQYAQRKQDEFIAKSRSFDVEWEGLKFMAINAVRCNSLTFEAATRADHDALMGFYWNGKFWNVSLYHAPHRKDLDLSAIAVKYGGGGHRGACGFRADKLPFIP